MAADLQATGNEGPKEGYYVQADGSYARGVALVNGPATPASITPVATEAHLGSVGGSLLSVVDNFNARPANTTAYTAGGTWNCNLTVSAVTNASPPVVTCGAHTLVAGQFVTVAGIVGATGANGNFKLGTVGGTTITLLNADGTSPSAPGVYVSGGTVAQLLVFAVGRIASGTGYITQVQINAKSTTTANGSFRVTFYNTPITTLVDQSAWTVLAANFAARIGAVDMPTLQIEGAGGDSAFSMATNINLPATTDVYGNIYAVVTAEAAYVPASGQLFSVKVTADRY